MPVTFSSHFLCSQDVVFIAHSWLVLVTMCGSCCVCKSTPCHTHTIATCNKPTGEKTQQKKNVKRSQKKLWRTFYSFVPCFFLYYTVSSQCTWLCNSTKGHFPLQHTLVSQTAASHHLTLEGRWNKTTGGNDMRVVFRYIHIRTSCTYLSHLLFQDHKHRYHLCKIS